MPTRLGDYLFLRIIVLVLLLLSSGCIAAPSSNTVLRSTEETEELFLRHLNDPSCELPCWMGITPGITSVHEVHRLFRQIGIEETEVSISDMVVHYYMHELAFMKLESKLGLVTDIEVEIILNSLSDTLDDFLRFSVESMITKHGVPDELIFILMRNVESSTQERYLILSFYSSENFLIVEEGVLINRLLDFRCFENQTTLRISLISSSGDDIGSLQNFWYSEIENPAFAVDYAKFQDEDLTLFEDTQQVVCG